VTVSLLALNLITWKPPRSHSGFDSSIQTVCERAKETVSWEILGELGEVTDLFESSKFVEIIIVQTSQISRSPFRVLFAQKPLESDVSTRRETTSSFVVEDNDTRIFGDFCEEVERFRHVRVIVHDDPLDVL